MQHSKVGKCLGEHASTHFGKGKGENPWLTDFWTAKSTSKKKILRIIRFLGAIIFFGRGSQIYKKSVSIITATPPIWATKILWPPNLQNTLPPKQAKIVLKSVFLKKINTICGHLVIPYILVIKHFIPLFFFPKIYDPQYICDPPFRRKW